MFTKFTVTSCWAKTCLVSGLGSVCSWGKRLIFSSTGTKKDEVTLNEENQASDSTTHLPSDRLRAGADRTFFFIGREPDKGRVLGGATERKWYNRKLFWTVQQQKDAELFVWLTFEMLCVKFNLFMFYNKALRQLKYNHHRQYPLFH